LLRSSHTGSLLSFHIQEFFHLQDLVLAVPTKSQKPETLVQTVLQLALCPCSEGAIIPSCPNSSSTPAVSVVLCCVAWFLSAYCSLTFYIFCPLCNSTNNGGPCLFYHSYKSNIFKSKFRD
jgi:hypothetical protein